MRAVTGEGLGKRLPTRNHFGVDIAASLVTPVVDFVKRQRSLWL
ncbi:hypothetical protein [Chroococcidiopsis sp. CCMEE 29]|nr:hypothetical protein [Chroococcidiopsis sp. CCMEE 29]